jgi:AcrR family transcriptional regulator
MSEMMQKISAGLERSFAARGFAEPSVVALRDAAGVSLRTLYKYTPSRGDMVLAALEYRHQRYLTHVFDDLPTPPDHALDAILSRLEDWMNTEATHGCLFHAAVAADPGNSELRALLTRHKTEVAQRASAACKLPEPVLFVLIEGLIQAWPLQKDLAVDAARRLAKGLRRSQA